MHHHQSLSAYNVSQGGRIINLRSIEGGQPLAPGPVIEQRLAHVFGLPPNTVNQFIRWPREAKLLPAQAGRRAVRFEVKDVVSIVLGLLATSTATHAPHMIELLKPAPLQSISLYPETGFVDGEYTTKEIPYFGAETVAEVIGTLGELARQHGIYPEPDGTLAADLTASLALWLKTQDPGHLPAMRLFRTNTQISAVELQHAGLFENNGAPASTGLLYYLDFTTGDDQAMTITRLTSEAMGKIFSAFIPGVTL